MKIKIANKIIALLFLLIPSLSFSQVLFYEGFSSGSQPTGWSNDSLGFAANHIWIFNNSFNRNITGANFDSKFAIFDSDEGGIDDGFDEDASLTTPPINISGAAVSLYLEFDQQFRGDIGPSGSLRILEMSTNGGSSWSVIDSGQTDIGFPNPAVHSVYDISSVIPAANILIRFEFIGSWDYWWAIDNVVLITRQPCTNAPNAGNAQSNLSSVCPSDTFYLSLNGADYASDFLYQWQSSPDNMNWNNLAGDTTAAINITQSSQTYYRCVVMCHSQDSVSGITFVSMNSPTTCYCTGTFTSACDILNDVTLNTLSNLNSDCNGNPNNYINYPDTGIATTTVHADSTYNLIIASGFGTGYHGAAAWFDFDHDGNFQGSNEFFHISDSIPELSPNFTTSITIPSIAAGGPTRMRVRYIYGYPAIQTSDCATYDFGETEDYTINIISAPINVENVLSDNIRIYPLPATNNIRITTGRLQGMISYNLFDQTGRLCLSLQRNSSVTDLNVSSLSRGIYFLRIENETGVITKKIVLE